MTPPEQLDLLSWTKPEITPLGGDTYRIRPGRPVSWLRVREFAKLVTRDETSIYKAIGSGALPDREWTDSKGERRPPLVVYSGKRTIRIRAEAVEHWVAYWTAQRA